MAYTWQYYDLVLFGIAASMSIGAGIGILTSVSLPMAIIAAGIVASAIIGHGLFVNGPVDEPRDLANEVDVLN
ncbi:hypothetical protein [Haladaptatus caseinilyticus]|uniref:hypothetical protein n=1 Tax=Haladaptatus caseinilyticus TaxID=2993314 RepID=UPI00224B8D42|nr:hypothetical protein [Haladaptatus caseinilyticus]